MAIFDLFSKRQKKLKGEVSDIYIYDEIPTQLRVQIIFILEDTIGHRAFSLSEDLPAKAYKLIHTSLAREYGQFVLGENHSESDEDQLLDFFLKSDETDKVIDVIELCIKYIDKVIRHDYNTYKHHTEVKMTPDEAIAELNERFKEHGIGYAYESGEIIKIDSTYIHSAIVKPTLKLLSNFKYKGANEEFLKAHEHYRHGRNKECLTECLKAFESTLKIICKEKSWPYDQNDSAKKLIQICFKNNLVPAFSQNQFTSLQNLLESGIPTIRNKLGGHGQGAVPQKVDDEMTRYALNLTGTNIVFLVEQSIFVS